jgi:hypothetical protein
MAFHNQRTTFALSLSQRALKSPTRRESSDVRIISSDGVTLHTSRALLVMISPVFRDMYDLGPDEQSFTSTGDDARDPEITLAEDSGTLSTLFAYADPTTSSHPTLNISQLFDAMTAAQKYLMEGTLAKLRAALNAPTVISSSSLMESKEQPLSPDSPRAQHRVTTLVQSAPLPVAVLCITFNFTEELRLALRELSRAHIDMIIRNNQDCMLPAKLFQYILKQRRARAQWFKLKAKLLFTFAASVTTKGCTQCMRYCGYAIHEACARVDDHPSWDAFRGELLNAARCSCGASAMPVGHERFQKDMAEWEVHARVMEAELPDWPPRM